MTDTAAMNDTHPADISRCYQLADELDLQLAVQLCSPPLVNIFGPYDADGSRSVAVRSPEKLFDYLTELRALGEDGANLQGYSEISVQEALLLVQKLEKLEEGQGIDLDVDEGVEAWKFRGAGIRPVYRTKMCRDGITHGVQYDTAAGLVMAWLERDES